LRDLGLALEQIARGLSDGTLNLCVRWGATTAVPASVRDDLAATTERWFNGWFTGVGSYGCFPYGDGIKVKITGWAVEAGQESLLAGVDAAILVYTETDSDGEPKCPDACSSFVHWTTSLRAARAAMPTTVTTGFRAMAVLPLLAATGHGFGLQD
jgi:hypothetical protein